MHILDVVDVHTYYGDSHVLHGFSVWVGEGSLIGVLGRNGVGKTTLIHSIMGFTPSSEGAIFFRGTEITHEAPYQIARMGIGLVPQGRRLFPSLTVKETLEIVRQNIRGAGWTLDKALSFFPVLKPRLDNLSSTLSGGEQQMLACARALVCNSSFLLMDEPTEGLAPLLVQELGKVIQQLKQDGSSILLVEQNLSFVLKLADHVYVVSRGKVVSESSPAELWQNENIKARYLGV